MFYLILLVFLLIGAGLALIIWQNLSTPIQLILFSWHSPHLPVGLWLVGFFVLGAALLYITAILSAVRERRELRMLRERVAELEREKAQAQALAQPPMSSIPPGAAGSPSGPLPSPASMPPTGQRSPTGPLNSNPSLMRMPGLSHQNPSQKPGSSSLSSPEYRQ